MIRATLALGLLLLAAPAAAEDLCPCPPPEPPPPLWTGSIGLSYLSTSGNSDSETIGLDVRFERQPTPWGVELAATANRAETDGEKTAERLLGSLRGKRSLSERWDLFAGLSWERDEFAGFDSRTIVEAGGLWHALLGPKHKLDFDLGLTWTREEPVQGAGDDSLGAVAGARYAWKISDSATLAERVVFYPNFDSSDDWRFRSETSIEAALASSWALRASYLVTRDNRPEPGFEKNDTTTSVSLVWKR